MAASDRPVELKQLDVVAGYVEFSALGPRSRPDLGLEQPPIEPDTVV